MVPENTSDRFPYITGTSSNVWLYLASHPFSSTVGIGYSLNCCTILSPTKLAFRHRGSPYRVVGSAGGLGRSQIVLTPWKSTDSPGAPQRM
jgi:hypothetical protein